MTRPLKLGIVGAGFMGSRIGTRVAKSEVPDFTLAGVYDRVAAAGERLAQSLGTSSFESLAALIERGRPDALYIATPDDAHREPCEAAAAAAVPFLVEKPLATTVDDAIAICRAAERAGIVAEVNFSNRWNPPFVEAKRRIASGELGTFVTGFARLNNVVSSPARNLAWAARTTPAWFLLSHCLDLAYWLHGRAAASVYASGVRGVLDARGVPTWDSIHAIVRDTDGGDFAYESVWIMPDGQPAPVEFTFRIVGDKGAVTVDTQDQNVTALSATRSDRPQTLNWTPARLTAFARTVRGEMAPGVSLSDGLMNTRTLVALHRSLESAQVEAVS